MYKRIISVLYVDATFFWITSGTKITELNFGGLKNYKFGLNIHLPLETNLVCLLLLFRFKFCIFLVLASSLDRLFRNLDGPACV